MKKEVYEFIAKQTKDPIVEWRKCRLTGEEFAITAKDLEFYGKVSPVFNGKKYTIPAPTLCPEARNQRRLAWRNERKLYKRVCDATGREIISIYSPDKLFKVYQSDFWWSDGWNALDYGKEFDFSRPFFEQFGELFASVPTMALANSMNENADYNNYINKSKNAYMSAIVYSGCDGVYYSTYAFSSKQIYDSTYAVDSEICYGCSNVRDCFECIILQSSKKCSDCLLSTNLSGCSHCLFCSNLTNQQYYIYNKKVSPEEFERRKTEILQSLQTDPTSVMDEFDQMVRSSPQPSMNLLSCENCVGNNLFDCHNSYYSYDGFDQKDCKWVVGEVCEDAFDGVGGLLKRSYEYCRVGWATDNLFVYDGVESNYCILCCSAYQSNHCFGCVGMKSQKYCIFNKQYTKEEYETLVPKIIEHMILTGEWGEFFPSTMSPFGYNETAADEHSPLSRPQVLGPGFSNNSTFNSGSIFNWSDYEAPFPKVAKIIPASKLPTSIDEIPDDILNWAIECEVTGKLFRIIREELEFYRKHRLPIPHRHPDQRHLDRIAQRPARILYLRKCDISGEDILSVYPPEYPGKVVSEVEYLKLQN